LTKDVWHHIALVVDDAANGGAGTMTVYVDGAAPTIMLPNGNSNPAPWTATLSSVGTGRALLGGSLWAFDPTLHGAIADFRIYDHALAPGEVMKSMIFGCPDCSGGPEPMIADFNENFAVEGTDFLRWQRGVGTADAAFNDGDATFDGEVDGEDLARWRQSFGYFGDGPVLSTPVPEPTAAVLLLGACVGRGVRRAAGRRNSKRVQLTSTQGQTG
jgi:hypothetical protein